MSRYINTLVYFYLALMCLFRLPSVFRFWNFCPRRKEYAGGKNSLLQFTPLVIKVQELGTGVKTLQSGVRLIQVIFFHLKT